MSDAAQPAADFTGPRSTRTFLGHPVGLFVLFFAEMWERFSYYGMRGLLKLYMANYLFVTIRQTLQGKGYDGQGNPADVLGWGVVKALLPATDPAKLQECIGPKVQSLMAGDAANGVAPVAAELARNIAEQTCAASTHGSILYGWYTGLVYLTPFFGGIIADRWLGQRKSVVVGGLLMAIGHFVMAFENSFFLALGLLILGNGAFKPNVSTQVGLLYPAGDPRRDGAFTIFYMGINIGAFLCNFVCGTLALKYGWHYGFGAAGVGMVFGLVNYLVFQKFLAKDNVTKTKEAAEVQQPLSKNEWTRVWALVILCALNVVFWAVYEQQGNTMQSWADEQTVWPAIPVMSVAGFAGLLLGLLVAAYLAFVLVATGVFSSESKKAVAQLIVGGGVVAAVGAVIWFATQGHSLSEMWVPPSTWFQSFNPLFIVLFAPLLDMFWLRQAKKGTEPSSVSKMAIGCIILGLSFIVMIAGAKLVGAGKGSLFWPVFCTLLLTIGELYLSPIGLSLVTKVSPPKIVSMMMGMWFISSFVGNTLSGYIGVLYDRWPKDAFFLLLTVLGIGSGLAMWAFNKPLKSAIGEEKKAETAPAA